MKFKRNAFEPEIGEEFKNQVGVIMRVEEKTRAGFRMSFELPNRSRETLHYTENELKKMQRLAPNRQGDLVEKYLKSTKK